MKTIAVISDTHINSTVALMPPVIELDDGQEVRQTKGQKWLWGNWIDYLEKVEQAKPDILIVNGDSVEADTKGRSYQLITRNKTTAVNIAAQALDPLCRIVKQSYFVRGTAAHVGKSGCIEEDLAKDLDAVKIGSTFSHFELHLDCENVKIHAAHHATMGGLPWTRKNAANNLAARVTMEYAKDRERAPDLVIRGHMHRWGDSWDSYPTRALFLPCWTLANEHVYRIAPDTLPEIGGAIIRCSAGKYEIEKLDYKPKGRTWVKI